MDVLFAAVFTALFSWVALLALLVVVFFVFVGGVCAQ